MVIVRRVKELALLKVDCLFHGIWLVLLAVASLCVDDWVVRANILYLFALYGSFIIPYLLLKARYVARVQFDPPGEACEKVVTDRLQAGVTRILIVGLMIFCVSNVVVGIVIFKAKVPIAWIYLYPVAFWIAVFLMCERRYRLNFGLIMRGHLCLKCAYDRTGLVDSSSPCPECGFVVSVRRSARPQAIDSRRPGGMM